MRGAKVTSCDEVRIFMLSFMFINLTETLVIKVKMDRIDGWLEKRGEVNTAWKKRWFSGGPDGIIYYYATQSDKKEAGSINLVGLQYCWDLPDAGTCLDLRRFLASHP
jgi:hypothetical protein